MAVANYSYDNPEASYKMLHPFNVTVIDPNAPNLIDDAVAVQSVMHDAWTKQFEHLYRPEQIAQSVDPNDPKLVNAQLDRIKGSSRDPGITQYNVGKPVYLKAWMPLGPENARNADRKTVGIAKANEQPRTDLFKVIPRESLADVSNIFVRPTDVISTFPLQSRGIGSALLRSALDFFPPDMETLIYEFPFNKKTVEWLGRLSFAPNKQITDGGHMFGKYKLPQTMFLGEPVGQLIKILEHKKPWLKDRIKI